MKVTILKNEKEESHERWMQSCINLNVDYDIIDLTSHEWLDKVQNSKADLFLARPTGLIQKFKTLFDERIYIIERVLKYPVFPSYEEISLHENKKYLSYFLKAARIPLPVTNVFYYKNEALDFCEKLAVFPIVGKTSNGASGTGVKIIRDNTQLRKYINQAFSRKGVKRRFGPNRNTGNISKWTKKARLDPQLAIKKIKKYFQLYSDSQKGFVIFQEYIPHDYEWRVVRIGESYFAHQKVKTGEMASGTKGITYLNPPLDLLDFVRDICERFNYQSMAIDIFEHPQKGYVVNEMQTLFGHVQDHIMEVDGKTGRYLYNNKQWHFEAGYFNQNESYDLRLRTAIKLFKAKLQ
jgi:glutathione synthase/RimK-type ligase-like ATP-grasp enzyme